jgi:16S rRNA (uracil1498-N3)-methyltransferase
MAAPWFYCPELAQAGARLTLSETEGAHAVGARRLRIGDEVILFDGYGLTGYGRLTTLAARGRALEVEVNTRHRQPPSPKIHLACALPKGDRQATLLDMATQLGMTDFTPLVCAHGIASGGPNSVPRWQRICLEACKQSRRAYLPQLHAPLTPAQLAAQVRTGSLVIAHPNGAPFARWRARLTSGVTLLVGPEGGFGEDELAAVHAAGGMCVSLGAAILRIETAAGALLALVAEALGEPRGAD